VFFDPFGDLGKVLVLLSDVVFFAEVDEVDNWFGCEKEEWVDDLDLTYLLAVAYSTTCVKAACVV
jgi:hypothetical protein